MYASAPDLVAALRVGRAPKATRGNSPPKSSHATPAEKAGDAIRLKALLNVCLELSAEVESLRALRESDGARGTSGNRSRR
jgi:hypothetical protein